MCNADYDGSGNDGGKTSSTTPATAITNTLALMLATVGHIFFFVGSLSLEIEMNE